MFGPSVEKLLVLLEREAAANGNDIGGDFMAWSKRLLSIAIIQGNARLASDYLRSFNQHCLRSSVYRTSRLPPQPSTRSSSSRCRSMGKSCTFAGLVRAFGSRLATMISASVMRTIQAIRPPVISSFTREASAKRKSCLPTEASIFHRKWANWRAIISSQSHPISTNSPK